MGRLVVITTPDAVPGFQLAGVETFAADSGEKVQALLIEFLEEGEASLIVVRQDLLETVSPGLRRRIESSDHPVVMAIPGGTPGLPGEGRGRYIAELIKRAIGFRIAVGSERPPHGSGS